MDTWATPRCSRAIPSAFTNGNPPLLWRTAAAIAFAVSSRPVARLTLNAINGVRAPMTAAPAVGCGRGGRNQAATRQRQLCGQLELTAADVGEVAPGVRRGGFFVEEHRNLEARCDSGCRRMRQRDTVGHRRAADRNERNDVNRAKPWMRP